MKLLHKLKNRIIDDNKCNKNKIACTVIFYEMTTMLKTDIKIS